MHVHLCVASWLFSPRLSCPLLRPTVLLPALPDVYLRVQREVEVQPPVRLPLGDRGHIRLRDTPHTGKPVKLSGDTRFMPAHDGTGEPVESIASTHIVKEQLVPAEHRGIASSNADKFNLAIDDENIDFNIPGVPNSMVKRSHGVNVHNLIQKIENHPQRQALQRDLQQHRAFNPSAKNHKT